MQRSDDVHNSSHSIFIKGRKELGRKGTSAEGKRLGVGEGLEGMGVVIHWGGVGRKCGGELEGRNRVGVVKRGIGRGKGRVG